ncbi:hypothetical protein Tco_0096591 [Tanacetum coccineum]
MDFAKPVKAIALPQDVSSTSDRRLIELKNQVQRLMEAHLAPMQPTQVNKVTTLREICSGPHDTQYCMENPKQAFVNYASSRNNKVAYRHKEDEAKEEDGEKSTATECKGHETTHEMEDEVERKEEVKKETEEEAEEEEEGNPKHFDIFPTMNELRLDPWRKLSNPNKNFNFIGRVRGLKVFVGNFTYKCDFIVLEDTTSVIDHYLGSMVFGKPFVEATGLVYNKEEGTLVFEKDKEKIVFKMPHRMNMFKHIDFTDISTDRIPPFLIKSDDDNCEKTHYSDSLDLGPEYKYDEHVCRGIRSLMAAKARRK